MNDNITIVTPTYNREYMLKRCYESLCNQTDKDFSWLVIDDGSTDNTRELIEKFQKERKIIIKYIKKENGGKASALNKALEIIESKYCACLDSDEYFSKNAIKIAKKYLKKIENNDNICGIIALRRNRDGDVLGGKEIPNNAEFIKYADIDNQYDIRSEVICFYKTDIINKFRFPEFKKEKFVSPAYMQYKVTQDYKFKVFRDPIIFCEYLQDGITKNKKNIILKNPYGYLSVKKLSYKYSTKIIKIIKHGIMYGAIAIHTKDKTFLYESPHKFLTIVLLPISYIVYLLRFYTRS